MACKCLAEDRMIRQVTAYLEAIRCADPRCLFLQQADLQETPRSSPQSRKDHRELPMENERLCGFPAQRSLEGPGDNLPIDWLVLFQKERIQKPALSGFRCLTPGV